MILLFPAHVSLPPYFFSELPGSFALEEDLLFPAPRIGNFPLLFSFPSGRIIEDIEALFVPPSPE